jgi:hypothetical protein
MTLGVICPQAPGHLNPLTALARQLLARNHDVVFPALRNTSRASALSHKSPRVRCDRNGPRSAPLFRRGLEQNVRYLIWLVEHCVMSALNCTNYPG